MWRDWYTDNGVAQQRTYSYRTVLENLQRISLRELVGIADLHLNATLLPPWVSISTAFHSISIAFNTGKHSAEQARRRKEDQQARQRHRAEQQAREAQLAKYKNKP